MIMYYTCFKESWEAQRNRHRTYPNTKSFKLSASHLQIAWAHFRWISFVAGTRNSIARSIGWRRTCRRGCRTGRRTEHLNVTLENLFKQFLQFLEALLSIFLPTTELYFEHDAATSSQVQIETCMIMMYQILSKVANCLVHHRPWKSTSVKEWYEIQIKSSTNIPL